MSKPILAYIQSLLKIVAKKISTDGGKIHKVVRLLQVNKPLAFSTQPKASG
jgi:hypothetical protein